MISFNCTIPVSNFPREDTGVLHTIGLDTALNVGLKTRFGPSAAEHSGADAASLLVSIKDLRDAAVRDAQLARDDARTDTGSGQFDDLQSDVVR